MGVDGGGLASTKGVGKVEVGCVDCTCEIGEGGGYVLYISTTNTMPSCQDEAKKMLSRVGMDYDSIYACSNDCILFHHEHAKKTSFLECGALCYRQDLQGETVPVKVLGHFPIVPRIQHMFRCKSIAVLMMWHAIHSPIDDTLRVPPNCVAWKHIDST